MPKPRKVEFLDQLRGRYPNVRKLGSSLSLFEIGSGRVRVYVRYSKIHENNKAWYGLRKEDLLQLHGRPSVICFLWDGQDEPLMLPFSDYEHVFDSTTPAADGQYKAQMLFKSEGTELFVVRAGRFNVEGHFGWGEVESLLSAARTELVPNLSHSQVQTMLGAIGSAKGHDIWVPSNDRDRQDWSIAKRFAFRERLPYGFDQVQSIIGEVDVIWIGRGSSELVALFEVEHSTPIYSGLLRLNDIHLVSPNLHPTFNIVANDQRRDVFVRQVNRPTFRTSGLSDLCAFLEYPNVYWWFKRSAGLEGLKS